MLQVFKYKELQEISVRAGEEYIRLLDVYREYRREILININTVATANEDRTGGEGSYQNYRGFEFKQEKVC